MSKSLINEAVLTQVLNHLRNGQLRRCAEMGLRPEILAQLQQPAVMSILTNTPVSWVDVRVNIDVMEKSWPQPSAARRKTCRSNAH